MQVDLGVPPGAHPEVQEPVLPGGLEHVVEERDRRVDRHLAAAVDVQLEQDLRLPRAPLDPRDAAGRRRPAVLRRRWAPPRPAIPTGAPGRPPVSVLVRLVVAVVPCLVISSRPGVFQAEPGRLAVPVESLRRRERGEVGPRRPEAGGGVVDEARALHEVLHGQSRREARRRRRRQDVIRRPPGSRRPPRGYAGPGRSPPHGGWPAATRTGPRPRAPGARAPGGSRSRPPPRDPGSRRRRRGSGSPPPRWRHAAGPDTGGRRRPPPPPPSAASSVRHTARAIGSCSAWARRSAATCDADAVRSATTTTSLGPATRSIPTSPKTRRLASAT